MAQIFHRSTNHLFKSGLLIAVIIVGGGLAILTSLYLAPSVSPTKVAWQQPVPFSHEHHVHDLGIDCRYCHTSVEQSSFAGIPSAKTCMTCHSQIWTNADMLQPVRDAYRTGQPIQWTRVHVEPDYVYFNHSIHVAKGVACVTCHGPIDRMPLTFQQSKLDMRWCLQCHRNPTQGVGPKSDVFKSNWTVPNEVNVEEKIAIPEMQGAGYSVPASTMVPSDEWVVKYHVKGRQKLEDCYTCHR